ncbi:MAG: DUF5320 domain-containing protein [Actinomycetota bacterium]|nr:DUF5320 domain-containing protein [Actinomycetota bacterium]
MPGFDGTGPAGKGPLTGRGAGYCIMPAGFSPVRPNLQVNTTGNRAAVYPVYGPGLRMGRLWQTGAPMRSGRRGRRKINNL